MLIARYYRRLTTAAFVSFTTDARWKEVVARGLDATGKDLGLLQAFDATDGAGGFQGMAGCSYEVIFSDGRFTYHALDSLRDPGHAPTPGAGITIDGEAPPPTPPHPYLDVPFQVGNVKALR